MNQTGLWSHKAKEFDKLFHSGHWLLVCVPLTSVFGRWPWCSALNSHIFHNGNGACSSPGDVARCRLPPAFFFFSLFFFFFFVAVGPTVARPRSLKFPLLFIWRQQRGFCHFHNHVCLAPLLGYALNWNKAAGFFIKQTDLLFFSPQKKRAIWWSAAVTASITRWFEPFACLFELFLLFFPPPFSLQSWTLTYFFFWCTWPQCISPPPVSQRRWLIYVFNLREVHILA